MEASVSTHLPKLQLPFLLPPPPSPPPLHAQMSGAFVVYQDAVKPSGKSDSSASSLNSRLQVLRDVTNKRAAAHGPLKPVLLSTKQPSTITKAPLMKDEAPYMKSSLSNSRAALDAARKEEERQIRSPAITTHPDVRISTSPIVTLSPNGRASNYALRNDSTHSASGSDTNVEDTRGGQTHLPTALLRNEATAIMNTTTILQPSEAEAETSVSQVASRLDFSSCSRAEETSDAFENKTEEKETW